MEASESQRGFPFLVASRRRFKPDDPFFAAGNIERELLAKQLDRSQGQCLFGSILFSPRNLIYAGKVSACCTSISSKVRIALDLTEDERYQLQKMEYSDLCSNVYCPIVGCGIRLNCLEDFEDHYHARHAASCSVCSRVYPTSRLLSIHISEMHDSFFQAKVARGFPMFECLVEGCELKLKSYKSRQQHLIDKHKFPTSFEFYKKARPSKHHRQKNQGKQSGRRRESKTESDMDVDGKKTSKHPEEVGDKFKNPNEMGMEVEGELNELVSAVSKLSTSDSSTPSSVSFGHRHARGFTFLPRSLRQPNVKQPSRSDVK